MGHQDRSLKRRPMNTRLQRIQAGRVHVELRETQRLLRQMIPNWKLMPPSIALRQMSRVQSLLRAFVADEGNHGS